MGAIMRQSSNKARRNRFNLTADTELVERVRAENGCLSTLLEGSMRSFLKQKELERWREENRQSFESYNAMIERGGLLSEDIGLL
jgi:post-segregation antitoxin (ccd killing protein)